MTDLAVEGLGTYPSPTRPWVIWAGIADGREAAGRVARLMDTALTPRGFPPEARGLSPHVTLGPSASRGVTKR
jgi:2'-5' RNA ligase